MIEKLVTLAQFLNRIRPAFVILGLGFFVLFIISVSGVSNFTDDQTLTFSLLGILWSCLVLTLIGLFKNLPPKIETTNSLWQRIKIKCIRAIFMINGILFIFLSIVTALMTFKLAGIALAG